MYRFLPLLFPVLLAFLQTALSACPPLGSVLPAPTAPSRSKYVQETVAEIHAVLQNSTAELIGNGTAVSIGVTSIYEKKPCLEFSYQPTVFNKSGTHNITGDTVYRIASVSKLFTAFAILQLSGKISLSDPVTKYVPELVQLKKQQAIVNSITSPAWDKITIEALLSHLSGIGADCKKRKIPQRTALTFRPSWRSGHSKSASELLSTRASTSQHCDRLPLWRWSRTACMHSCRYAMIS